jgi:hypothetical protein
MMGRSSASPRSRRRTSVRSPRACRSVSCLIRPSLPGCPTASRRVVGIPARPARHLYIMRHRPGRGGVEGVCDPGRSCQSLLRRRGKMSDNLAMYNGCRRGHRNFSFWAASGSWRPAPSLPWRFLFVTPPPTAGYGRPGIVCAPIGSKSKARRHSQGLHRRASARLRARRRMLRGQAAMGATPPSQRAVRILRMMLPSICRTRSREIFRCWPISWRVGGSSHMIRFSIT